MLKEATRKLARDDIERLLALCEDGGLRVLDELLQSLIASDFEGAVLNYDLVNGEDRKLVALKHQLEGARRLQRSMIGRLKSLKTKAMEQA